MIYKLISEQEENKKSTRTFRNETTGTETKLQLIFTDKDGGKWWGFTDLYKIPMMRMAMVRNITDMYTIGLSLKDIQTWCSEIKGLAKGSDPEKYEKIFSRVLEMENIAMHTADPIKQQLALCTVYILSDQERIDYFDEQTAQTKLQQWKGQQEMITFFLTWHTGHIQGYIKRLDKISTTVLNLQAMQQDQGKGQLND